ncbi:hypothetical protein V2J09_023702 [Rumex salicifolius]
MSKAGTDGSTGEEEEEEEDDDDGAGEEQVEEKEECFYESLDRILSSSNSSTSASEDEDVAFNSPSHLQYSDSPGRAKRCPKFPMCVQNYDVWISESAFSSASIQQRRDRLLHALGLSSDATLSRRKPSGFDDGINFGRSASPAHPSADSFTSSDSFGCSVIRSTSRGSACNECEPSCHRASLHYRRSSLLGSSSHSPTLFSIPSFSGNAVNSKTSLIKSNNSIGIHADAVDNLSREGKACLNYPCTVNGNRSADEIHSCDVRKDRSDTCGKNIKECIQTRDGSADLGCTIKNLDTGKEFVVNEVMEDGMWKKLREIETGKQLTIEEFEMCVGHSPIVQELMRRQNAEEQAKENAGADADTNGENGGKSKKRVSWFKSIKNVATSVTGIKERRSSDEREASSEKSGRRSSSATDDGHDISSQEPQRVRIRQYGKSVKELTALYKSQEFEAHNGSIWSIKFSLDGKYLATAGEDCVIHVWQVVESERKGELLRDKPEDSSLSLLLLTNGSPEPNLLSPNLENPLERRRWGRTSISRKSVSSDHIVVPETVFGLSEKPFCSFTGHLDDVLDLSWSKSQLLLSSSMDKTVRLWSMSSKTCLKIFSHIDYVTCIQFNPVDDRYFISGSLDAKVRIWSIPDRQVVDWSDLHEMVTAACYTPDGQGALVGSYKGTCRLYNTSENKLQPKSQINLQNKKKRSPMRKITGFQFAPGSSSEVLITSADSRVRLVDGVDLVHKFKGFRNTNSQISASISTNGKYVVSASEDSNVYIWKHKGETQAGRSKSTTVTCSYEHFYCQDVSVAIPWPGIVDSCELNDPCSRDDNPNGATNNLQDETSTSTNNHPPPTTPIDEFGDIEGSPSSASGCNNSPFHGTISAATKSYFFDRFSATWPEEKLLMATKNYSPRPSLDFSNGVIKNRSAWGLVIVTAGLKGEIRTFQNFGLPIRFAVECGSIKESPELGILSIEEGNEKKTGETG